jgi:hypothetical protein
MMFWYNKVPPCDDTEEKNDPTPELPSCQ